MSLEFQPDHFIAQLIIDYLNSDGSIAAGVPPADELPRVIMDSGEAEVYPSIIVAAREKDSVGAKRNVLASVVLATWLTSDECQAEINETTSREQASKWLRKIERRMANIGAFGEWLTSLDESRLAGWTFLTRPWATGDAVPLRGEKKGLVFYAGTYQYRLMVI